LPAGSKLRGTELRTAELRAVELGVPEFPKDDGSGTLAVRVPAKIAAVPLP